MVSKSRQNKYNIFFLKGKHCICLLLSWWIDYTKFVMQTGKYIDHHWVMMVRGKISHNMMILKFQKFIDISWNKLHKWVRKIKVFFRRATYGHPCLKKQLRYQLIKVKENMPYCTSGTDKWTTKAKRTKENNKAMWEKVDTPGKTQNIYYLAW